MNQKLLLPTPSKVKGFHLWSILIDSDVELYKFDSGAPNEENYTKVGQELIVIANEKLKCAGVEELKLKFKLKLFYLSIQKNPAIQMHCLIKQERIQKLLLLMLI